MHKEKEKKKRNKVEALPNRNRRSFPTSFLSLALYPDVNLSRSGLLDTGYRVWMTPLPMKEDKSG